MRFSIISSFPLAVFVFFLLQSPTFAIEKSYIVYLGGHRHGPDPTSADLQQVTNSHYELLGSYVGSIEIAREKIFYSYTRAINGFAAVLDEQEAAEIAKHPKVVSVFLNRGLKLQTTHSWDFLGLEKDGVIPPYSLWKKARFGENVIIANLDSGVWPESKSFTDEGMGPIPLRWKGSCQDEPDDDDGVHCNRKLIGVRYFNKGYAAHFNGTLDDKYYSARDRYSHGTHTLSTAAGNIVPGVSVFGIANGTAKGGAPKARVAAYKVCWSPGRSGNTCFEADVFAGFDAAISDGVDVISVSLGLEEPPEYFEDGISIGSFHALSKGISVVAATGNSGPRPETASNLSPWFFTVGASTLDRNNYVNYVELGNNARIKGVIYNAPSFPSRSFYPLISPAMARAANASVAEAIYCKNGTLDPEMVKGKIIVCLLAKNRRTKEEMQDLREVAVGFIFANDKEKGDEVKLGGSFLPATHISFSDGETVFAYINSTKEPTAYITPRMSELGKTRAPLMAVFSSQGPNVLDPSILKPDITAPGVDILAAVSEADEAYGEKGTAFNMFSGTSMSCPHVSGIVGLLKTIHPDWSPSAIKSAIMTTARTRDNTGNPIAIDSNVEATPFSYGAGHVRPNCAANPGLVYDLTVDDYLNYLCNRGYNETILKPFSKESFNCSKSFRLLDFNYPSISVPKLNGSTTVSRKVKNVGSPGTYRARVRSPAGVRVSVKPSTLTFEKMGEEKKFEVTFEAKRNGQPANYVFGQLVWTDGYHCVRSPLVVKA